mmetsp:Transcript_4405/g.12893  ORF Transcript_4405/g.12893 Transcript_4405/m.12893 type:complete len:224 (+) Transcript_4405:291-962(+)
MQKDCWCLCATSSCSSFLQIGGSPSMPSMACSMAMNFCCDSKSSTGSDATTMLAPSSALHASALTRGHAQSSAQKAAEAWDRMAGAFNAIEPVTGPSSRGTSESTARAPNAASTKPRKPVPQPSSTTERPRHAVAGSDAAVTARTTAASLTGRASSWGTWSCRAMSLVYPTYRPGPATLRASFTSAPAAHSWTISWIAGTTSCEASRRRAATRDRSAGSSCST